MAIVVTGAAGFIGFHVCQRLLARGDHVIGVDSVNDYYDPALKEARLQTYKVSVEDTPDIDEELGKTVTSRGKAESTSAKARDKMEKTEVAWQSAVATATALAP